MTRLHSLTQHFVTGQATPCLKHGNLEHLGTMVRDTAAIDCSKCLEPLQGPKWLLLCAFCGQVSAETETEDHASVETRRPVIYRSSVELGSTSSTSSTYGLPLGHSVLDMAAWLLRPSSYGLPLRRCVNVLPLVDSQDINAPSTTRCSVKGRGACQHAPSQAKGFWYLFDETLESAHRLGPATHMVKQL